MGREKLGSEDIAIIFCGSGENEKKNSISLCFKWFPRFCIDYALRDGDKEN